MWLRYSLLGHKNIQHTVRYTELSRDRFKDFWRD
jgi:type 1 fimbriae regulatory protein FimB/type 1 fimbriae regulatory protein FimE